MTTPLSFSSLLFHQRKLYVYSWPWWISVSSEQTFQSFSSDDVLRKRILHQWALSSAKTELGLNVHTVLHTQQEASPYNSVDFLFIYFYSSPELIAMQGTQCPTVAIFKTEMSLMIPND